MERRHHEGDEANEAAEPAFQLVGRAFLFLDELLRLQQRLGADDGRLVRSHSASLN